jgi:hypothetical protein
MQKQEKKFTCIIQKLVWVAWFPFIQHFVYKFRSQLLFFFELILNVIAATAGKMLLHQRQISLVSYFFHNYHCLFCYCTKILFKTFNWLGGFDRCKGDGRCFLRLLFLDFLLSFGGVVLWRVRPFAFFFCRPGWSVPPKFRFHQRMRWRSPRSEIVWILQSGAMSPPLRVGKFQDCIFCTLGM